MQVLKNRTDLTFVSGVKFASEGRIFDPEEEARGVLLVFVGAVEGQG